MAEKNRTPGKSKATGGAKKGAAGLRGGRGSAGAPKGAKAKTGAPKSAKVGIKRTGKATGKGTGKTTSSPAKRPVRQRGPKPFGQVRYDRDLGPVQRGLSASADFSEINDPDGMRLQKVMAQAGVASRRASEELILSGRVEVDGKLVTDLGVRVNPATQVVRVDGMRLNTENKNRYYAFNKPQGVVSTMDDPEGRRNISDFLKQRHGERLFHVGRLDTNTEGLILLTNDGELANRLAHPRYEVPKTYLVQVRGPIPHDMGAQMRAGIALEDGVTKVDSFKLVDSTPGKVLIEVVLHSGKNRIVRRLFSALGYPVLRLVRVKFGPVALGNEKQGTLRPLSHSEVAHLMDTVGL